MSSKQIAFLECCGCFLGQIHKVVEKDEWPASYCTSSAKSEVSDHTSLSHLLSFPLLLRYYCDSTDLLLRLLFGS